MIPMTTQPTKLTNMALPTMGCGGASEVDEMHCLGPNRWEWHLPCVLPNPFSKPSKTGREEKLWGFRWRFDGVAFFHDEKIGNNKKPANLEDFFSKKKKTKTKNCQFTLLLSLQKKTRRQVKHDNLDRPPPRMPVTTRMTLPFLV